MYKRLKMVIDLAGGVLLFFCCSPLFLVIAIIIKIDSEGPIFYKTNRVGKDGKLFRIYKFRSMVKNADQIGEYYTSASDNRITKVGKFLRNRSLDELPQIINIIAGEMSFIGPRPIAIEQIEDYSERDFALRHSVLPGISGLAQVMGRSYLTEAEKLKYDLEYARNISVLLDMKILLKTLQVVFLKTGTN